MNAISKFLIILAALIYVISPVDLIPDFFIPFLGWIDDTVVISALIYFLRTGKFPNPFSRKFSGKGNPFSTYTGGSSHGQNTTGNGEERFRQKSFYEKKDAGPGSTHSRSTGKDPDGDADIKRSPHEILGVSPTAGREEIKTAYRTLARQYHPDRTAHLGKDLQELAEKRFKEINKAYTQLTDALKD